MLVYVVNNCTQVSKKVEQKPKVHVSEVKREFIHKFTAFGGKLQIQYVKNGYTSFYSSRWENFRQAKLLIGLHYAGMYMITCNECCTLS